MLQFFVEIPIDGAPEQIVGFAHPDLVFDCIGVPQDLFIDCTFKCVPKGFAQCLILMIYSHQHGMYVPIFYVLMTCKKEALYKHAFQNIVAACSWKLFGKTLSCDFEKAIINVAQREFPEALILGCYFHWKQAIRRQLEALHIDRELINQLTHAEGLLGMLTVIPVKEIESKGIPYIRSVFPEGNFKNEFDQFWKYFVKTWLNSYDPKVSKSITLTDPMIHFLRFGTSITSKIAMLSSTEPTIHLKDSTARLVKASQTVIRLL
jgi:hypothetical protein